MQHNRSKYSIPVNQLADFTRSSDVKKRNIVQQQKKPPQVIIARYGIAKIKLRKFIASRGDISLIYEGIQQLNDRNAETEWQIQDKKVSLEAMERFIKLELPTLLQDLDSYEILTKIPIKSFILSGVDIVVSPDIIFKGKIGGKTYIGAVKIHISKSSPFTNLESQYVATCIYNYLNSFNRGKDILIAPELCLCIDAFGEVAISIPKNIEKTNFELSKYCNEIISIWNNTKEYYKIVNEPKYSKSEIKKSGNILKQKDLYSEIQVNDAEDKLTYWRTVHGFPLAYLHQQTFITGLSNYESLISKRIKRSASIINKLKREKSTNLTTMQDLAGYRIVLSNVEEVYHINNLIVQNNNNILELQEKYTKDYIEKPKASGYRGIHLIFKYRDSNTIDGYDYLNLELQIRTKLQHIWATAVETAGILKNFSLKANEGPTEWLDFFKLASAAFSIYENCPKNTDFEGIPDLNIFTNTVEQFKELEVEKILKGITVAFEHIKEKKYDSQSYNLVTLNLDKRFVNVKNFKVNNLEAANNAYTECERLIDAGENLNVVLVSTNSIQELQEAYPSYFGDANEFIKKIEELEIIIQKAYSDCSDT